MSVSCDSCNLTSVTYGAYKRSLDKIDENISEETKTALFLAWLWFIVSISGFGSGSQTVQASQQIKDLVVLQFRLLLKNCQLCGRCSAENHSMKVLFSLIITSFFRWEKVTVVQLKSSGDNQPFSSLQWRMAVPKIYRKQKRGKYVT